MPAVELSGEREGQGRHIFHSFGLYPTSPVLPPLFLGHVSEMWHPEELKCTFYFQYCSPQGSRNHKPSSSKLQDWVKSHKTAVKITFQGSFSLPPVFRDLVCLLQQKKVKTCIIFWLSVRQSCGKKSGNFMENTFTVRYVVTGNPVFARHKEWDDFSAQSWKVLRTPCKCKMGMLSPSSSFIVSVL